MTKVFHMTNRRVVVPLTLIMALPAAIAQTPPPAAPPTPPAAPAAEAPYPLVRPMPRPTPRAYRLLDDVPEPPEPPEPAEPFAFAGKILPPVAFQTGVGIGAGIGGPKGRYFARGEDGLYQAGLNALDNHRYDEALEIFNQVASRAGSRADGAWYWKAYTLNKLGKRDEAVAAITELRKAYPNSRWLDDAKALEVEVKQQAGRPVSPEGESDEELKLLAINGVMQSDPERGVPLVENLLKGASSRKIKDRALYVLAQNSSPRAQQAVEQVARGAGNPDLQVRAIEYLGAARRKQGNNAATPAIFPEIYAATNDINVKRAILRVYESNRDYAHLAEVARSEKNPEIRASAWDQLGNQAGQPELWQVYQTETSPDVKEQLLNYMHQNGNAEKLAEVARNEKDPKVRRSAIRVLADQRATVPPDLFVSIYNTEQDPQNKKAIVEVFSSQGNAKALVSLARAEKDPAVKLSIVQRLSNSRFAKDKDAQDYLAEILSK
jgi:tetratricopeptide (TPR) repeat protein